MVTTLVFVVLATILLMFTKVSEAIALMVAGIVAPVLSQYLKKWLQIQGTKAVLLTMAVTAAITLVITLGSGLFSGELKSGTDILVSYTAIFGTATLVYKLLLGPPDNPPTPPA